MKHYFEFGIGFSVHGAMNILALGSVPVGSRLFDKINTKNAQAPDCIDSRDLIGLKNLVFKIRQLAAMLSDVLKFPMVSEAKKY